MSIGVLHGQNGGTGLAVKVVGGTQKPSNAKQGVIWVNTDQKITGWTMQVEEPTEPTEGMVWIAILTHARLNALKKNGIWFTPTSAKQYSDGGWVKKTGEYYNNDQWVALFEATIHITYPVGSTCTVTDGTTTLTAPDTSGTWDCVAPNAGAWAVTVTDKGWTDTAEITQDGQVANIYLDKLYLYKGGVVRNAYFVHNGAVTNENGKLIARMGNNANQALLFYFTESISGINSIQIKARVISTGSAYHTAFVSKYDIYSSATNNRLSAVDMPATSDERVYSIDLSGINDPIYLWFMFHAYGTDANVEISEIGGI